jgi:hypothetical protein
VTELDSSTATDPTEADTYPGCSTTHGVQRITGTLTRGPDVVVHGVPDELDDHGDQPRPVDRGFVPHRRCARPPCWPP